MTGRIIEIRDHGEPKSWSELLYEALLQNVVYFGAINSWDFYYKLR